MNIIPTVLDTRFLVRAKAMLDKYGKAVTFYPVTDDADGSAYNATTGTTPDADLPAVKTKGAFILLGAKGRSPQDRSAEGVRQEDHFMYVPGADFVNAPKAADKVVFDGDGQTWRVLAITSIYSGERVAMYGVFLKKP